MSYGSIIIGWQHTHFNGTYSRSRISSARVRFHFTINVDVVSIYPSTITVSSPAAVNLTVYGVGFVNNVNYFMPYCKIGTILSPAAVLNDTTIQCTIPAQSTNGSYLVYVSLDGTDPTSFTSTFATVEYIIVSSSTTADSTETTDATGTAGTTTDSTSGVSTGLPNNGTSTGETVNNSPHMTVAAFNLLAGILGILFL